MKINAPSPGAEISKQPPETTSWDPYAVWLTRVKHGDESGSERRSGAEWDPYEVWRKQIRKR